MNPPGNNKPVLFKILKFFFFFIFSKVKEERKPSSLCAANPARNRKFIRNSQIAIMTAMPDFLLSFYIFLVTFSLWLKVFSALFSGSDFVQSLEFEQFNRKSENRIKIFANCNTNVLQIRPLNNVKLFMYISKMLPSRNR